MVQLTPAPPKAELIAQRLGGAKKSGKQWLARCPCHDDHSPSLSISDTADGNVLWYCFTGCDAREVGRELHRRGLLPDRNIDRRGIAGRPRRAAAAPNRGKLAFLMSKLRDIEGTPVETYLRSRDLELPPDGHHLRYLPAYPPKHPWPVMVGIVTDLNDADRIMSLHMTRLLPNGYGKAPLPKHEQRSFLGGYPIKGGVIRLCGDADIERRIGFAEGVETSLAVSTAFRRDEGRFEPVWAALSAGNMADLPVLAGIETSVIYADRGPAGEKAADRLGQRWLAADRELFIAIAPVDDWNPAVASSVLATKSSSPLAGRTYRLRCRISCSGSDTYRRTSEPRPRFPMWNMMETRYLERMAEAGIKPEQIDMVMCTHLHVDHIGWNTRLDNGRWVPTFPNALRLQPGRLRPFPSGRPRPGKRPGDLVPRQRAASGRGRAGADCERRPCHRRAPVDRPGTRPYARFDRHQPRLARSARGVLWRRPAPRGADLSP
jgi:putative DNA primase/helicase